MREETTLAISVLPRFINLSFSIRFTSHFFLEKRGKRKRDRKEERKGKKEEIEKKANTCGEKTNELLLYPTKQKISFESFFDLFF